MIDLSFSLEGGEVVHRQLGVTADALKSYREPLQDIGRNFMKTFDMNFSSRGALYGGWAPRKPQYRQGRRVDTWPLLEKTGRMRKSFEMDTTPTSLILSNGAPYFQYHQSNGERHHLPRRVMMKIRGQDATVIVKTFQQYVVQALRGSGER